jgi:hypothetical protein
MKRVSEKLPLLQKNNSKELGDPRIIYRPSNSCFFQIRIALSKHLVLEKTRSAAAAKTMQERSYKEYISVESMQGRDNVYPRFKTNIHFRDFDTFLPTIEH